VITNVARSPTIRTPVLVSKALTMIAFLSLALALGSFQLNGRTGHTAATLQ
jgi:hypothetical protein